MLVVIAPSLGLFLASCVPNKAPDAVSLDTRMEKITGDGFDTLFIYRDKVTGTLCYVYAGTGISCIPAPYKECAKWKSE